MEAGEKETVPAGRAAPRRAGGNRGRRRSSLSAAVLVAAVLAGCSGGSAPDGTGDDPGGEAAPQPAAGRQNPLRNPYFGDLHVHTSWSLDSYVMGHPMTADPAVAYRYGRGDAILDAGGNLRGQLRTPLDFMAVTDHDNFIGETLLCQEADSPAYDTPVCQEARGGALSGFFKIYTTVNRNARDLDLCGGNEPGPDNRCDQRAAHQWPLVQEMADAYYEPGVFTTFTAFEFTASDRPTGGWLHRNVFFRGEDIPPWGGASITMQHSPERLWAWMEETCTGDCDVIAIPHNTNYGMGIVLGPQNADGTPFTEEILRRRARFEPLIEIHQVKGNSECSTGLLTADEDCNFEQIFEPCDPDQAPTNPEVASANCTVASNFVRNALKTGLAVEAEQGINPFKYGVIGSTDDHRSASGSVVEQTWEGDFFGEIGATTPGTPLNNPGGLAAVWAEQNTRESIFDALRRRETFATSGPRILVRAFGGWTYPADLHTRPDMVEAGYAGGVPMGGDLPPAPADAGPARFSVWAAKDANGANLQKIQMIKGWADTDGGTHERVFDVVCADGLEPHAATHRCADNGAQVNLADCSVSSGLGAAELSTTWTDAAFDPAVRAFYYVRVLENPTCRWTTWQALETGAALPDGVPPVIKERAWSSPIWYTPEGS